jgi:hypothetical protein
MAKGVRGSDGLTERDRYWLRHLRRQAAGTETSKVYAAGEGLSVHALYQARKHLVARGAWPAGPKQVRRGSGVESPRTPSFARVTLGAPALRHETAPACRLRLGSGAVIEWNASPPAGQLAELLAAMAALR